MREREAKVPTTTLITECVELDALLGSIQTPLSPYQFIHHCVLCYVFVTSLAFILFLSFAFVNVLFRSSLIFFHPFRSKFFVLFVFFFGLSENAMLATI